MSAIGSDATDFHAGSRVVALQKLGALGGSFAECALVWDWAALHFAKRVTFKEAATVPKAAFMASISLFGMLEVVPSPWTPVADHDERPLVIYGAAGTVGAFAVKVAKIFNVGPLISVAGRGIPFMGSLIGEGDAVIDYMKEDET